MGSNTTEEEWQKFPKWFRKSFLVIYVICWIPIAIIVGIFKGAEEILDGAYHYDSDAFGRTHRVL